MNLGPFAKPAIFAIGDARAHCAACQGSEFIVSRQSQEDAPGILACTGCGKEYPAPILMQQLVRKVIERADVALKRAEYLEGHLVAAPPYVNLLLERLGEAESLLRAPASEGNLERAIALLNEIALDGPTFAVRIEAFNAIALASAPPGGALFDGDLAPVLGRIRQGLEEAKKPQTD